MLNVMKMKLFPYATNQISIPNNEPKPYNIIFVSENSDFLSTYPKLNIRRQYAKKVSIIPSVMPRIIVTASDLMPYKKSLGLIPITRPDNSNTFIDTGLFFTKLDEQYGKSVYSRPVVLSKIITYLTESKKFGGYNSILIYHADVSKDIPEQLIQRRSVVLAMIAKVGEGAFPFDNVLLAIEKDGLIKYMSIYNKDQKHFDPVKITSILKQLSSKEEDLEKQPEEELNISAGEPVDPSEDKASILRFIDKHRKNKVLTS